MKVQNEVRAQQISLVDDDLACAHCGGVVVCEAWCESVNTCVQYAYDVVLHPTHLSFGDHIILHALGVRWTVPRNYPKRLKNG